MTKPGVKLIAHGAAKSGIAAVDHLIDIFHFSLRVY